MVYGHKRSTVNATGLGLIPNRENEVIISFPRSGNEALSSCTQHAPNVSKFRWKEGDGGGGGGVSVLLLGSLVPFA